MSDEKTYKVLRAISHRGDRRNIGEEITMTDEEATNAGADYVALVDAPAVENKETSVEAETETETEATTEAEAEVETPAETEVEAEAPAETETETEEAKAETEDVEEVA